MQTFEGIKQKQSVLFDYLISCAISVAVSLVFAAIFALLMTYFTISPNFSALFSTVSYISGCFIGGAYLGFRNKSKGMLLGSSNGLTVFILSLLIALLINKSSFSLITVFHLLGCVLSGAIGGIFSVNKATSKNYNLGKYK